MALFPAVGQRHLEELFDVFVVQPIVKDHALAAVTYQVEGAEQTELVADRGFADLKQRRQIADAHLTLAQRPEDAEPTTIGKGLEQLGHAVGLTSGKRGLPGLFNPPFVDDAAVAEIFSGVHSRLSGLLNI